MTKLKTKNLTELTPNNATLPDDLQPEIDPTTPAVEEAPPETVDQLPEVLNKDGRGANMVKWDREMVASALEMIAGGATASAVGKKLGFTQPTWSRWLLNVPGLAKLWGVARQRASHALFDEALDTARRNAANPTNEVKNSAVRTLIETLKWGAARLNPESYGEKATPGAAVSITINTTLPLSGGYAGRGQNIADVGRGDVIDIEPANREYKITATIPEIAPAAGVVVDKPQRNPAAVTREAWAMRKRRARAKAAAAAKAAEEQGDEMPVQEG